MSMCSDWSFWFFFYIVVEMSKLEKAVENSWRDHHSLHIFPHLRPIGTGNSRCHCTPNHFRCMFDPRNRTHLPRIRLLSRGVCVKIIKMGEIKHRKTAVNPERQKIEYPLLEPLSLKAVYKIANDELIATASAKYRICTTFVFDWTESAIEPQKFLSLRMGEEKEKFSF